MNVRRLVIGVHDLVVTWLALLASFFLRWGSTEFWHRIEPIMLVCLLALPPALVAHLAFRLPQSPWKYVSISDLSKIVVTAAIPALVLALAGFVARDVMTVPRTVPVIAWVVQICLLAGPRVAYRIYRTRRQERRAFRGAYRMPVLIAGTGDEAEQLIRRLSRDAVSLLEPVALLATRARHVGELIGGVPILGRTGELEAVLRELGARGIRPKRLLVTREALDTPDIDAMLAAARRLGLSAVRPSESLRRIGAPAESGPVTLAPISIDDLLNRSSREMDMEPVRALIAGRRVVVTGAGGSIGSELCRQIAAMGPARLLLLDLSELALWTIAREIRALHPDVPAEQHLGSVFDRADLARALHAFRPDLVFHAAALKHVDIVEAHPVAAAATNTIGTHIVAEIAREVGATCAVFISTDKAVDPVSVLGATKRAGELVWGAADRASLADGGSGPRFLTVRFGNVLGSSGSVIPLFTEQLRQGGPITVTHPDVERYFMTISEAVRLVLMASALGVRAGEVSPTFVLDMGQPVRIVDLARRMIRLAGLEPEIDVEIRFTGLRPGEKLSEALQTGGEHLRETAIPGVRATDSRGGDEAVLTTVLGRLSGAIAAQDAAEILAALDALVPEYKRGATAPS